jgi:hypothetical protein
MVAHGLFARSGADFDRLIVLDRFIERNRVATVLV